MAALDWKVGTMLTANPGIQVVTGVGFQPKAIIFYHGNNNLLDSTDPGYRGGVGFADDSGNNVCTGFTSGFSAIEAQSVGESTTHSYVHTLTIFPGATFPNGTFFVMSMDPDGFTIDNDTFAGPNDVYYMAIGGTAVTAQCGRIILDSLAADDVEPLPLTPSISFFLMGAPGQDVEPSMILGNHHTFGATNGTQNYSNAVWRSGLFTGFSNRGHNESTTHPIHQRNHTGTIHCEATALLNPNELRIVKNIPPPGLTNLLYLALEGVGSDIANFPADEAIGATKSIAGVGFTPIGQIFTSAFSDGDPPGGLGPSADNDFSFGGQSGITPFVASGEAYALSWRGNDDYGDGGSTAFDTTSSTDSAFLAGAIGGSIYERFNNETLDADGYTIRNIAGDLALNDLVTHIMLGEEAPPGEPCVRGKRCTSNFGFAFGEYGICGLSNSVPDLSCIGIECAKLSPTPVTSQEIVYDLGADFATDFEIADIVIIQGLKAFLYIDDPITVRVQGAADIFFTFPDEEILPVTLADLTGFESDTFVARLTTFTTARRFWRVIIDTTTAVNFPLNAIALGKELRLERSPIYPARFRLMDEFTEAPRAPWQLNLSFEGILEMQKEEVDRRLLTNADVSPVWLHDASDGAFFGNRIMRTFLTSSRIQVRNANTQFDIDLTFEEVVYSKP